MLRAGENPQLGGHAMQAAIESRGTTSEKLVDPEIFFTCLEFVAEPIRILIFSITVIKTQIHNSFV